MDNNMLSSLLTLFGISGIIQGLGMKYNKKVRKKLMLDAKGIDKRYINIKINFFIFTGILILIIQGVARYNKAMGDNLQIILSAVLLLAITSDMIYKKVRNRKSKK